jgi:hypothetical protein
MKHLLMLALTLAFVTPAFADQPRDLKKNPLTSQEWRAYRAAKRLAKATGVKLHPSCVNASEEGSARWATVQFFTPMTVDTSADCGDPHYSISVEFDKNGKVISVTLTDA